MIKTFKKYKDKFHDYEPKNNNSKEFYYVYRITNIKLNKHYYGSRGTNIPSIFDLGTKYFSSSTDKEFIKDQKENPQNYKYKIVKIFNNNKDKILFECFLHQYFNVKINENFYNKTNAIPNGFDLTGTKFKLSLESLEKRKKTNLEKYGVEYSSQSFDSILKRANTWLKKSPEEKAIIRVKKTKGWMKWYLSLTDEEIYKRNLKISKSVKETMSQITPEVKKERYEKVNKNRNHKKAGINISKSLSKRTKEQKEISYEKSKQSFRDKYGEDITCGMHVDEIRTKVAKSLSNTIKNYPKEKKAKIANDISIRQSGENNNNALNVIIYDSEDNIKHICKGNFFKLCKELKYPAEKLRKTLDDSSVVIYPFKDGALTQARKRGYDKYIGWYIRKIENV